ncbi:SDR family oxidoreductase [Blastococcus sp. TF02A-26]|uniref:SDR family NAD(P)-dependent oxidoreductase n=1 Tax=Blastococcus sp. TF02A-26 TaxID=2250577 RepID=UPI000DE9D3B0|nr:SDR family oxidoreductase [Blastococcus sp. TF02A-26]RBY85992.1 SDR family NAD(P)-dependent oxidoreductase [Blastococcus sp. TF02A-26]
MSTSRSALVTGASRGIGRAIAERLAGEGFDLTITARDAEALERVRDDLVPSGSTVLAQVADVRDVDQVHELARAHLDVHRGVDLVVVAAGMGVGGDDLATFPLRRLDAMLDVNLRAPFALVQALLPALREAGTTEHGGKVIALASITGVASEPGLAAYGASKAALISLCESITVAEAGNGVSATAISPGFVDTDMAAWVHDRIPTAGMIRPSDVAEMVIAVARLSRNAAVPNIVLTRPGPNVWRA